MIHQRRRDPHVLILEHDAGRADLTHVEAFQRRRASVARDANVEVLAVKSIAARWISASAAA